MAAQPPSSPLAQPAAGAKRPVAFAVLLPAATAPKLLRSLLAIETATPGPLLACFLLQREQRGLIDCLADEYGAIDSPGDVDAHMRQATATDRGQSAHGTRTERAQPHIADGITPGPRQSDAHTALS